MDLAMIGCSIFLVAWLFFYLSKPLLNARTHTVSNPTGYSVGEVFEPGSFLLSFINSPSGSISITRFTSAGN